MSTNVRCGRHRADHTPKTPLTALSKSAADAARKAALAAAASGIIATTLSGTASAAPEGTVRDQRATGLNLEALNAAINTQIDTAPVVKVAPDARLELSDTVVEVKPAPEPAPAPAPRPATGAPEAAAPAPARGSSLGARVVSIAMEYVGTPYVYGGESPGGFDCSGLVKYAYAQLGVALPHSSSALRGSGTIISAAEARPGDLIWTPGHIAIYAGDGMVVEAVSYGTPLSYRAMWQTSPTFVRVV